jgi:hypothetical protein
MILKHRHYIYSMQQLSLHDTLVEMPRHITFNAQGWRYVLYIVCARCTCIEGYSFHRLRGMLHTIWPDGVPQTSSCFGLCSDCIDDLTDREYLNSGISELEMNIFQLQEYTMACPYLAGHYGPVTRPIPLVGLSGYVAVIHPKDLGIRDPDREGPFSIYGCRRHYTVTASYNLR